MFKTITLESVPRKAEVVWQELEGEVVLLNPKTGEYFGLNEVAGSFWEKVDGKKSLGNIIKELLEEYDVKREELEKDLQDLIEKMRPFSLILFD